MGERQYGVRELLGAVNLRDFIDMVGAEVTHIGASAGLAVESLTRMPFGPFAFVLAIAIIGLRSCLLFVVVVVFGSGILAISAARTVLRLMGGHKEEATEEHNGEESEE